MWNNGGLTQAVRRFRGNCHVRPINPPRHHARLPKRKILVPQKRYEHRAGNADPVCSQVNRCLHAEARQHIVGEQHADDPGLQHSDEVDSDKIDRGGVQGPAAFREGEPACQREANGHAGDIGEDYGGRETDPLVVKDARREIDNRRGPAGTQKYDKLFRQEVTDHYHGHTDIVDSIYSNILELQVERMLILIEGK